MTITLTPHAEELLQSALARGDGHSPQEVVERALEMLVPSPPPIAVGTPERILAIHQMKDFGRKHALKLESGETIQDLIREGRRFE